MSWFGFWIFMSVFLVVSHRQYMKGHCNFLFEHKTDFEKDMRDLLILEKYRQVMKDD